jgi:hypothetical protein
MKISNIYLYEGLAPQAKNNFILWESVGRTIKEAALNPAQITQLFQQIEQGATAAGGNRTAVGQTKDAAVAAAGAWKDLKNKIYDSAPMQNFASAYDQAAEKLKQATGGDQGAMQYVQKYRDFAKKHPIIQGFVYSALIAAAGISSAGLGGAAALALLKTTDKALQGEDIRSALYSGAKTGALAYGASKLGDYMKGGDQAKTGYSQGSSAMPANADWQDYEAAVQNFNPKLADYVQDYLNDMNNSDEWKTEFMKNIYRYGDKERSATMMNVFVDAQAELASASVAQATQAAVQAGGNVNFESRTYTPEQVTALFEHIIIAEGLFDKFKTGGAINTAFKKTAQQVGQGIKQGAAAVGQQIQRVGRNITTKTTADKLQSAWKAAGSPTDSEAIIDLLTAQGIDNLVIDGAMKAANVVKIDRTRLPDVSKLNLAQKQQLLAQLDAIEKGAPMAKTPKPKVPYSAVQSAQPGKITAPPNPGAPTPDEQAKFQQKLQAAMQKQA